MSDTFQKILLVLFGIGALISAAIHSRLWLFEGLAVEWGQMILMLTILLFLFPLLGVVIWRNLIKKHL